VRFFAVRKGFGGRAADDFNPPGSESTRAYHLLAERSPAASGTSAFVVFHSTQGPLDTQAVAVSTSLDAIAGQQHVVAVTNVHLASSDYGPRRLLEVRDATLGRYLEPGDEVLLTDHEYGAVARIWEHACRRAGAKLVVAELPCPIRAAEEVVEAILAGVTVRTRALVFSHGTSPTRTLPAARFRE